MNWSYRTSLICGAVPLCVGAFIFLLWLVTRWTWLMLAGIFTLYGGIALFLLGVFSLVRFRRLALHSTDLSRRHIRIATIGSAGLLFANFPVAGGIIIKVVEIETCYTIIVHNASTQPLRDVRAFGGGCEAVFGTISAGSVAERSLWIQQDGQLEFTAKVGGVPLAKTIDDYVTHGIGGRTVVVFDSDGNLSASGRFDPNRFGN